MATTKEKKTRKKGLSTKDRKSRITYYFEIIYPVRKLRRIWHDTGKISDLRRWADAYVTPTGASGNAALVRLAKELKLSL